MIPSHTVLWSCTVVTSRAAQVGSQYRRDAEAAGAVVNGKWVPKAPTSHVLQGTPPGPFCRDLDAAPPQEATAKQ